MANYTQINSNRTDKEERVLLWQNKLIAKARAFKCDFKVDRYFLPSQAMVTYRDRQGKTPIIQISEHLAKSNSKCGIIAILHELGHVIDYRKHESNFITYIRIGNGEVEVRAWEFAFELARQIGFTPEDFKEMHEYALECLYSYSNDGTNLASFRDLQVGFTDAPLTWKQAQERMDKALADSIKRYKMALYAR